jgi:hypothetical protein
MQQTATAPPSEGQNPQFLGHQQFSSKNAPIFAGEPGENLGARYQL